MENILIIGVGLDKEEILKALLEAKANTTDLVILTIDEAKEQGIDLDTVTTLEKTYFDKPNIIIPSVMYKPYFINKKLVTDWRARHKKYRK